jgi:hypothetical protein
MYGERTLVQVFLEATIATICALLREDVCVECDTIRRTTVISCTQTLPLCENRIVIRHTWKINSEKNLYS